MVEKLTERKKRENQAVQGEGAPSRDRLVSDESLFNELGASLKRVK